MTQCSFVNEVGNSITIEVVMGDPGKLCRFSIIGPESTVESYVTFLELEKLGATIAAELRPGETGDKRVMGLSERGVNNLLEKNK